MDSGCVADCVSKKTGYPKECTGCFGDFAACGIKNCMSACLMDKKSPKCIKCGEDNCGDAFEKCSGSAIH